MVVSGDLVYVVVGCWDLVLGGGVRSAIQAGLAIPAGAMSQARAMMA